MTNVVGDSAVAGVPGVLGENSANGDGVFGQGGGGGRGVVGVSSDHTGVEGTTTNGIAVFGGATAGRGRGVVGVSNATTAVEGNAASGDAVYGVSATGIGVHGKGGHLGGYFEGAVEITGNLTIQGVSLQLWLQRVVVLERLVTDLEARIKKLKERPLRHAPMIQATMELDPNAATLSRRILRVFGGGFQRGESVTLQVTYRHSPNENATVTTREALADKTALDGTGAIDWSEGVICGDAAPDQQAKWTIVALSRNGSSNTAAASCF